MWDERSILMLDEMKFRPVEAPLPIPLGMPWELLEHRPDFAAVERTTAEANAAIGIAYAAYYPSLTLTAEGGFESSAFHNWLSWPSRFWSIGASLPETIFDAGLRRATVQQYVATHNADLASYRQTVLSAFQKVEDGLAEVRILSKEIQQEQQAVDSAQTFLKLEQARYETGIDPYLDVLIAQTTVLANQQSLNTLQVPINIGRGLCTEGDFSRMPPCMRTALSHVTETRYSRSQSWVSRLSAVAPLLTWSWSRCWSLRAGFCCVLFLQDWLV